MQRFELTEEIHRPVEEVWRCLTEPYFASQWMKGVEGIIKIGDEPTAKGTKLKTCRDFVGRRIWTNLEVTQYVEHEVYELYSDERDVRCRYTYRIISPTKDEVEDAANPDISTASTIAELAEARAKEDEESGPIKIQLVVEYKIGGFASFFSSVFDKLIEEHESDHLELLRLRLEPAEMPSFAPPEKVQVSEIMSSTPKIDPDATLQEIADANDSSVPKTSDGPRRPNTMAESEAAIAQTLNSLDLEEQVNPLDPPAVASEPVEPPPIASESFEETPLAADEQAVPIEEAVEPSEPSEESESQPQP